MTSRITSTSIKHLIGADDQRLTVQHLLDEQAGHRRGHDDAVGTGAVGF